MSKRVKFSDSEDLEKDFSEGLTCARERKHGFIEDNVKFTAFNMKYEKKFGDRVDEDGFEYRRKPIDDRDNFLEKDNWLDGMEDDEEFLGGQSDEDATEEDEQQDEPLAVASKEEQASIYREIGECLNDDKETVAKAIKRLGGSGSNSRKRVFKTRRKNVGEEKIDDAEEETAEKKSDMGKMLHLTELASRAVNEFDEYDIYSHSRTKLLTMADKALGAPSGSTNK